MFLDDQVEISICKITKLKELKIRMQRVLFGNLQCTKQFHANYKVKYEDFFIQNSSYLQFIDTNNLSKRTKYISIKNGHIPL